MHRYPISNEPQNRLYRPTTHTASSPPWRKLMREQISKQRHKFAPRLSAKATGKIYHSCVCVLSPSRRRQNTRMGAFAWQVAIYIIFIYIHTHTNTQSNRDASARDGVAEITLRCIRWRLRTDPPIGRTGEEVKGEVNVWPRRVKRPFHGRFLSSPNTT